MENIFLHKFIHNEVLPSESEGKQDEVLHEPWLLRQSIRLKQSGKIASLSGPASPNSPLIEASLGGRNYIVLLSSSSFALLYCYWYNICGAPR